MPLFSSLKNCVENQALRSTVLRGFCNAFKSDHRLSRVLTRGLAVLAVNPAQLDGSFLGLMYKICNSKLETVLTVTALIDPEMIRPQSQPDGVIDSLCYLAASTDSLHLDAVDCHAVNAA